MDILEDLFYGEIVPCERELRNREQCSQLMQYISRHENTLTASLSEEQGKVFEKYRDSTQELQRQTELDAFICGFRLGGRMLMAVAGETGQK